MQEAAGARMTSYASDFPELDAANTLRPYFQDPRYRPGIQYVSEATEAYSNPLEDTVAERVIKNAWSDLITLLSIVPLSGVSFRGITSPDIDLQTSPPPPKVLCSDMVPQYAHSTRDTVLYLSCKLFMGL
jgi:hypothetical protein